MHLELFNGVSGRQCLEEMSKSRMYGDEIAICAMAYMFNVDIVVLSALGKKWRVILTPEDSIPYHILVLGHFAEEHGCHYATIVLLKTLTLLILIRQIVNCDIGKDYTDVSDIQRKSVANPVTDSDET